MNQNRRLAQELDRVARKIDAHMHKRMPKKDAARVGPMGALLLMQLETSQPCSIQTLATAMGRDNSQLTRLIRDLEKKGVLARKPHETDKRISLLHLTDGGHAFLSAAKDTLTEVVEMVIEPLSTDERQVLVAILGKL